MYVILHRLEILMYEGGLVIHAIQAIAIFFLFVGTTDITDWPKIFTAVDLILYEHQYLSKLPTSKIRDSSQFTVQIWLPA